MHKREVCKRNFPNGARDETIDYLNIHAVCIVVIQKGISFMNTRIHAFADEALFLSYPSGVCKYA